MLSRRRTHGQGLHRHRRRLSLAGAEMGEQHAWETEAGAHRYSMIGKLHIVRAELVQIVLKQVDLPDQPRVHVALIVGHLVSVVHR